jgi:hypothetical protein
MTSIRSPRRYLTNNCLTSIWLADICPCKHLTDKHLAGRHLDHRHKPLQAFDKQLTNKHLANRIQPLKALIRLANIWQACIWMTGISRCRHLTNNCLTSIWMTVFAIAGIWLADICLCRPLVDKHLAGRHLDDRHKPLQAVDKQLTNKHLANRIQPLQALG